MICEAARTLIKQSEGLRLRAYLCPAGVPTIGYGHTRSVTAEDVRLARKIRLDEAEALLDQDLAEFDDLVRLCCTVPANENQHGAMVSLAFNIGAEGFRKSSVLRAHNRGDWAIAAQAFSLWNKATVGGRKVVLPGLVARRAAEAALYLQPVGPVDHRPMPQAVEPEKPMAQSSIMQGGVITAAASALATLSEAARHFADIRSHLGDVFPQVALLVTLVAGCWIIWQRWRQRAEGVA
jgi:lysozyme